MKWFPELPDFLRSKPGQQLAGPCHHFEVALVKPDPKAKKDCPLCRGRGVYTALHVGEYDELPMGMKCACTNGRKKMEINGCYNENCLDTMAKMPDGFIDLTVTSPPYDNLRTYNGYSFDFEAVAKELYRVTKLGGVVVWVVGDATIKGSETGTSFKQALFFKECGFNLHDTMIYHKPCLPKNHNRYEQDFEYMFVFSKGKPKTFNPIRVPCLYPEKETARQNSFFSETDEISRSARSGKKRKPVGTEKIKGNIWKINAGAGHSTLDKFAFNHPAIFPENLANDHIISWSNEGDLVYDPFMGSGTTAKMATLNKRNWIGSEISEEYCKIIGRRITTAST